MSNRRTRLLAPIALIVIALIAIACSSSDEAPEPLSPSPTVAPDPTRLPTQTPVPDPTPTLAPTRTPAPSPTPAPTPIPQPVANLTASCLDEFHSGVDYFPEKSTLDFASNFSVEYHPSYKVVTVIKPRPGGAPESYVLLQCGAPMPDLASNLAGAPVIEVPVETMYVDSTTALPSFVDLGVLDALRGVQSTGFITSPAVRERIDAGQIVEYAPAFEIDVEAVLDGSPDLLMTGGFDDAAYPLLRDAGIPVVANAEWLEETPLGRAEWIKFIGAFFNQEGEANSKFSEISDAYQALLADVGTVSERPRVMAGHTFFGTWFAPGGEGYVASIIRDAGGDYVLSDRKQTSSVETDIESMIDIALDADIWIDAATRWITMRDAIAEEDRYTVFDAVKSGQVWNYGKIMTEAGGVDFFERGVSRPDLVLADIVKIIHPALAVDHEFVWYQRIPPN